MECQLGYDPKDVKKTHLKPSVVIEKLAVDFNRQSPPKKVQLFALPDVENVINLRGSGQSRKT